MISNYSVTVNDVSNEGFEHLDRYNEQISLEYTTISHDNNKICKANLVSTESRETADTNTKIEEQPMKAKEFISRYLDPSWGTKSLYKYLRAYNMINENNIPHAGNILAGNMTLFNNKILGIYPKLANTIVSFIKADNLTVLNRDTRVILNNLHNNTYSSNGQGVK